MKWRKLVSLGIGGVFVLVSYTGVCLYLRPHARSTASLHTLMALLFALAAIVHLVNNRRAFAKYLRTQRRRLPSREVVLVIGAMCVAWIGGSAETCGVGGIYDFGNRYRAEQRGEKKGVDGRQWIEVDAIRAQFGFSLEGIRGEAFGYPMFSLWMENIDGSGFETLFISQTLATSRFEFGKKDGDTWKPAVVRRPQALPVWSHRYGHVDDEGFYLPPVDDPRLDAVSGATPTETFTIRTGVDLPPAAPFDVYLEVNQSYDWNDVFSKDAFPDDQEYIDGQTGQPSVVYWTRVDRSSGKTTFVLEPIGYGHPGGKNGTVTRDLDVLTSALDIVKLPILRLVSHSGDRLP